MYSLFGLANTSIIVGENASLFIPLAGFVISL